MKPIVLSIISLVFLMPDTFAQHTYLREASDRYPVANNLDASHPANPALQAAYEDEYYFPMSVSIKTTTYSRGGKLHDDNEMRYYINGSKAWLATCGDDKKKKLEGSAMIVFDLKSNTMLILNTHSKTGKAMPLAPFQSSDISHRNENWQCHKTGAKRIIMAYRCEQCICIDEARNLKEDMWITRDIHADLAPAGTRSAYATPIRNAYRMGGMLMEGQFYENGEVRSAFAVSNVDKKAGFTVSLGNYRLN